MKVFKLVLIVCVGFMAGIANASSLGAGSDASMAGKASKGSIARISSVQFDEPGIKTGEAKEFVPRTKEELFLNRIARNHSRAKSLFPIICQAPLLKSFYHSGNKIGIVIITNLGKRDYIRLDMSDIISNIFKSIRETGSLLENIKRKNRKFLLIFVIRKFLSGRTS